MPFYGNPSRGCEACRAKKVKCDARKPGCERCERYGRSCPGYRDLGRVIFRDENPRITRRATQKRESKQSPAAEKSNEATSLQGNKRGNDEIKPLQLLNQWQPESARPLISTVFGPSEGICYFYQEFSWETVPLHAATLATNATALNNITAAIGLALLSFKQRDPSLARQAYSEYGTAMQIAKEELSDTTTAALDSTLASVVLMSFFETITGLNFPSAQSWVRHSNGAAAIIAMRKPSQLNSPIGYGLFLESQGMMITTGIIYKTAVPKVLSDYTRFVMGFEPPTQKTVSQITLILIELINLRAAINTGATHDVGYIRRQVDSMHIDLAQWKSMLPSGWDYDVFTLGGSETTLETRFGKVRPYAGSYSVYASDRNIMSWSYFRICHILIGEILLGTCKRALMEGEPGAWTMCQSIRQNMRQKAADICASIPYLLGLGTETELPSLIGGYIVLQPLWVAACVESDGHPLRQAALALFDVVAGRIGIGHASILMQYLSRVEGTTAWLDRLTRDDVSKDFDSLRISQTEETRDVV